MKPKKVLEVEVKNPWANCKDKRFENLAKGLCSSWNAKMKK
jgi:hypothetical protein